MAPHLEYQLQHHLQRTNHTNQKTGGTERKKTIGQS